MITIMMTIIITFIFTTFLGHIIHWSLHQSWMGRFNKSHMVHHLEKYPPNDYLSDVYRDAGKDKTTLFFLPIAILLALLILLIGSIMFNNIIVAVISIITLGIVGWLHNYLHDSFHIKNHFLGKISFFNKIFNHWNKLHYLHHVDMSTNYGIFTFYWDRIFQTFRNY